MSVGPVRLAAAPARKPPVLPDAETFLVGTRDYWATLWASPMAAAWVDADVPGLVRLTRLVDLTARGDDRAQVLSEIRQLEDRFGLSPLARRRLQWEIDQISTASVETGENDPEDARWLRLASA